MEELYTLHPGGLFLRREALEHGYDDRDLTRAVRSGLLVRPRHGAYVSSHTWRDLDEVGRHRLRARSVMLTHDGRVALSHVSGAVMHGMRVWGVDLARVHITRLDGLTSRQVRGVAHHAGGWGADQVTEVDGVAVLLPHLCALGTAMTNSVEAGLVTLDAAHDQHSISGADLLGAASEMERWPGRRRLQVTLRLARPGSQSVGETRLRYALFRHHLPAPELQYRVHDSNGRLVGITDLAWPEHRALGEFDGRIKYGRLLRPGESPGDAVFREKVREDRLREATGWKVIRFVWDDLDDGPRLAERVRRALGLPVL